jgi:hypothetical protein
MTGRPELDRWVAAVAADPENAHIGRWSTFVVRLEDDEGGALVLRYERGTVVADPVGAAPPDLVLRGPRSAWRELVDADAAPRRHDLLSLTKAPDGLEVVAGRETLLRHLRVLTRLVELGRAHAQG